MHIKELSLASAFRYLSAGIAAWAYLAVLDWPNARALIIWPYTVGGGVGATALLAAGLLAGGALIYFLYRALFFETIVLYINDAFRWWTDNYRTWLSLTYGLTLRESQALADLLGEKVPNRVSGAMARAHAGTHLLYITGFVGLIEYIAFIAGAWHPNQSPSSPVRYALLLFIIANVIAAFLQERYQENHELLQFRDAFDSAYLSEIATRIRRNRANQEWRRPSDRFRRWIRCKYPRERYGQSYDWQKCR